MVLPIWMNRLIIMRKWNLLLTEQEILQELSITEK